jgi:hypothetical protein
MRSNPTVKLITPTRLGVPPAKSVVDFIAPTNNGPLLHDLTSDTNRVEFCDDQGDKVDPDVLEWIKSQDKQKYKVTWCFQETWATKLPWAEYVRGVDSLYDFVRCITCTTFETRKNPYSRSETHWRSTRGSVRLSMSCQQREFGKANGEPFFLMALHVVHYWTLHVVLIFNPMLHVHAGILYIITNTYWMNEDGRAGL